MSLAPLPGDAGAIRSAAADLQATIPQLRTAHQAAVRLDEVLSGEHWQGLGFEAFRSVVERKPLPAALAEAIDRMGEAADHLRHFAVRFEEDQRRLEHLRAQAAAVQASIDPADPASAEAAAAELRSIEQRAQEVHHEHRASLDQVAATFEWLSEEPTFAQPPPSTWERFTGALGDAGGVLVSFGTGVVEGFRDMALGIYELAKVAYLLSPMGLPELLLHRREEVWNQALAVFRYIVEDPLGFAGALGTALLDLDMLRQDPARWLGRRVPDLLLTLATGGAGGAGTRAARAARGVRGLAGARVADRVLGRHVPIPTAEDAAGLLRRSDGIAGGFARIGVDAAALGQHGSGAFARTDHVLGRLALDLDAVVPMGDRARQLPGLALDEIRGFTDLPVDAALRHLPDGVSERIGPWTRRTFGNLATGGLTGQLGSLDGLLVGGPVLSPGSYGTIAAVAGLETLNDWGGYVTDAQTVLDLPNHR